MLGAAPYGTVPSRDNPVRQGLDPLGCNSVCGFRRIAGAPEVRAGTGHVIAESVVDSLGLA